MRKEPGSVNDKWNISVVICDTDSPYRSSDDFNLTKRNPWLSSFLVSSNPLSRKFDRNHKLWNIVLSERDILPDGTVMVSLKTIIIIYYLHFSFVKCLASHKFGKNTTAAVVR
jgi:hypothetical protein